MLGRDGCWEGTEAGWTLGRDGCWTDTGRGQALDGHWEGTDAGRGRTLGGDQRPSSSVQAARLTETFSSRCSVFTHVLPLCCGALGGVRLPPPVTQPPDSCCWPSLLPFQRLGLPVPPPVVLLDPSMRIKVSFSPCLPVSLATSEAAGVAAEIRSSQAIITSRPRPSVCGNHEILLTPLEWCLWGSLESVGNKGVYGSDLHVNQP